MGESIASIIDAPYKSGALYGDERVAFHFPGNSSMKTFWCALCVLLLSGCIPPESQTPHTDDDVGMSENDVDDDVLPSEWTWVDIPESTCGNGTPTGLGISEGTDPTQLMIFFNGGGACWDGTSCYIFNGAANIETTYGAQRFANDLSVMQNSGVIDRNDGPFARATQVFVPYCTADLHSGDSIGAYDAFNPNRRIHHKGAVNVEAYLAYLTQAYPDAEEIFLLGVSAGGYGAMINHHRVQNAYPHARVHVLSDCAPMVRPLDGRWNMWKNAWNMQFPEGCDDCADSFPEFAAHVVDSSPESRFGLLAWHDDAVIALYFSYHQYSLANATQTLIENVYPDPPGGHSSAFHMGGTEHVMLPYFDSLTDGDGLLLRDFVQAWVEGSN